MFTLEGYWRNLLFFICKPIYKLIVVFYELFNVVGTADILDSEVLNVLYTRIGTILGVYMMFRIIFSFIQMLINPDYISDKEKGVGKIVSKVVLTILLMGITPYIFSKAMELQNFIVGINSDNGNIIAKIILPNQDASSYDRFGADLSAYLFTSFYQFAEDAPADARASCSLAYDNWTVLKNAIVVGEGNINSAKLCLDDSFTNGDKEDSYVIDFTSNGLFAVIVGGIVCYILIIYTIMVAVRVIQLAFLRIISPMAILTFLSPKKDTMFSKWLKMCTTTYLDLFIRMAIIYFVIFIITLIMGSDSGVALSVTDYDGPMWVVNIVMILALLFFAKKAPELLKELFPSSGVGSLGFGLKSPKGLLGGMLLGGALTKGYDKLAGIGKKAAKGIGQMPFKGAKTLGKRTLAGVDSKIAGKGFFNGFNKEPGFIRRRMEKTLPETYKAGTERREGKQDIAAMHNKWISGNRYKEHLKSKFGLNDKNWADVFNGKVSNQKYYDEVYKNQAFANSARNLDLAKEQMKAVSSVHAGLSNGGDMKTVYKSLKDEQKDILMDMYGVKNSDGSYNMSAYNDMLNENITSFNTRYEKQQKIVSAAESTHDSMRKAYSKDATTEDQISFRKNNLNDPSGR